MRLLGHGEAVLGRSAERRLYGRAGLTNLNPTGAKDPRWAAILQPSTSASITWIRSSAVLICVRSRSLFLTASTMPARPLRLVPPAGLRGRPGPRFEPSPLDDFTT